MRSIKLSEQVVQFTPNAGVLLTGTQWGANETISIKVKTPNNSCPFVWKVKANERGSISEWISLNSGRGLYVFEVEDCSDVKSVAVFVGNCALPSVPEGVSLSTNKTQYAINETIDVYLIGTPQSRILVAGIYPGAHIIAKEITLDSNGTALVRLPAEVIGDVTITASIGAVVNMTKIAIRGKSNTQIVKPIDPNAGLISAYLEFDETFVENNDTVGLVLVIRNNSDQQLIVNQPEPITISPELTLSVGNQVSNEPIRARGTRTFPFYYTSSYQGDIDQIATAVLSTLTYEKDGKTYSVPEARANIFLVAPKKPCAIELYRFRVTPNRIKDGSVATLTVTVKNVGQGLLTNVGLLEIDMPTGITPNKISFDGVSLQAGKTYTYQAQIRLEDLPFEKITPTDPEEEPYYDPMNVVFLIPEGAVYGNCQEDSVFSTQALSTTLNVYKDYIAEDEESPELTPVKI